MKGELGSPMLLVTKDGQITYYVSEYKQVTDTSYELINYYELQYTGDDKSNGYWEYQTNPIVIKPTDYTFQPMPYYHLITDDIWYTD
jgi:hypothetical protein